RALPRAGRFHVRRRRGAPGGRGRGGRAARLRRFVVPQSTPEEEKNMKRRLAAVLLAVFGTALAAPAGAQDAYVVGVTGAITGPAAGTYAPAVEGIRAYVEHVNRNGGVNGRPIRLIIADDQGQASRAAANARKLLTQDNVVLLMNASL